MPTVDTIGIEGEYMPTFKQFRDDKLSTDGTVAGFYEREFYVFSNFSSFQVEWRGKLWPTSEHAYQAARYADVKPEYYEAIRKMRSAHQAYEFMLNNRATERPDWFNEKLAVMKDILRHKLQQHAYVQKKLLETGDAIIVEDSPVDPYWGWGPNKDGENNLGTIWMELREELKDGKITEL